MAECAVPILPSRDLRETFEFYERLGSRMRAATGVAVPDPLTTAAVCYLRADDADAVHAEWEAIDVPGEEATGSRLQPPVLTAAGCGSSRSWVGAATCSAPAD